MREVPLLAVLVDQVFIAVPEQSLAFVRQQRCKCRDDVGYAKNFLRSRAMPFAEAFFLEMLHHDRMSLFLLRTEYGLDALVDRDGNDRAVDETVDQLQILGKRACLGTRCELLVCELAVVFEQTVLLSQFPYLLFEWPQ